MSTTKSIIMSVLGLAIALILIGLLGSTIDQPAWAFAETIFTPTPTFGKPQPTSSPQDIPVKTDNLKSPGSQAVLPSPNTIDDVLNGDFENGSDGSWQEYSFQGYDIILHTDNLPVSPHGGDWAAWLGGAIDEVAYISQSVAIPSDITTLSFWHWVSSEDFCSYDFAWVRINDADLLTLDLCEQNNTGGVGSKNC